MENSFICENCGHEVKTDGFIGVKNRNHCPVCLASKHVDIEAGDRKENCKGTMIPVALTFKKIRANKYKESDRGELMIVHLCKKCGQYSINRIAADDDPEKILEVFQNSLKPFTYESELSTSGIEILTGKDRPEIMNQLFGKKVL